MFARRFFIKHRIFVLLQVRISAFSEFELHILFRCTLGLSNHSAKTWHSGVAQCTLVQHMGCPKQKCIKNLEGVSRGESPHARSGFTTRAQRRGNPLLQVKTAIESAVLREGVSLRGPTARLLYDAFALIESQSQSSSGSRSASASCSPSPSSCCSFTSWSYCRQHLIGGRRAEIRQLQREKRHGNGDAINRAVVRRAHRPVCRFPGGWEGAVAEGRVRGEGLVRGGGMRVTGGEQHVLSMPGGAVLLARVPAHGREGAQAGVHGGTAMSIGESEAAMSLEEAWSVAAWQVKVCHSARAVGEASRGDSCGSCASEASRDG
jgi:hypothetical protein